MGIFAKRNIQKYEELTFNYNVDRYGCVIRRPSLSSLDQSIWIAATKRRHVTAGNLTVWGISVVKPRRISQPWTTYISTVSSTCIPTSHFQILTFLNVIALGITDEDELMELKGTKKKRGKKIDDPDFMARSSQYVFRGLQNSRALLLTAANETDPRQRRYESRASYAANSES